MRERNFFGVRTIEQPSSTTRSLVHGTTLHGNQVRAAGLPQPTTYYHPASPIGQLISGAPPEMTQRTAVIGLGTGTMAAHSRPGERWTFYEIDPAIARVASDPRYFTYLRDAPGSTDIVLGDARLSLQDARDGTYGLIVADAFSSDAIPTHLITREALALYFRKLTETGTLAFHVSNRYLDLKPVLGNLAREAGLTAWSAAQDAPLTEPAPEASASVWVALSRSRENLGEIGRSGLWIPCRTGPGLEHLDRRLLEHRQRHRVERGLVEREDLVAGRGRRRVGELRARGGGVRGLAEVGGVDADRAQARRAGDLADVPRDGDEAGGTAASSAAIAFGVRVASAPIVCGSTAALAGPWPARAGADQRLGGGACRARPVGVPIRSHGALPGRALAVGFVASAARASNGTPSRWRRRAASAAVCVDPPRGHWTERLARVDARRRALFVRSLRGRGFMTTPRPTSGRGRGDRAGIGPVLPYLLGRAPGRARVPRIGRDHRAAMGDELVARVLARRWWARPERVAASRRGWPPASAFATSTTRPPPSATIRSPRTSPSSAPASSCTWPGPTWCTSPAASAIWGAAAAARGVVSSV